MVGLCTFSLMLYGKAKLLNNNTIRHKIRKMCFHKELANMLDRFY